MHVHTNGARNVGLVKADAEEILPPLATVRSTLRTSYRRASHTVGEQMAGFGVDTWVRAAEPRSRYECRANSVW
jgi:hypothetical protein